MTQGGDWLGQDTSIEPTRKLVPIPASAVKLKRIRWLFANWIVLGALNLLAGREGLGKSTLAVWIVAHISRGTLAGELHGQPRYCVYLCTEDDPAFTVAPRLTAAGADLDRVIFLTVHTDLTEEGMVTLPRDLTELERIVTEFDVALVVLDAATSIMDARLDGHDDRKVRQFLEPLAQSAGRHDYSVLGICHFGKRDGADTGKLILGSVAWSQVARSVLAVALNEDTGDLVITNTKKNLAPDTHSASARIVSGTVATEDGDTQVGHIEWLGETDDDARELLSGPSETRSEGNGAQNWLEDYLTEQGSVKSKTAKDEGVKAGFSQSSVDRAARKLKVVSEAKGFPRVTFWSLPATATVTRLHAVPDSHVTDTTEVPRAREGDATDVTGADQAKLGDATGEESQLRHGPMHDATGDVTAESGRPELLPDRWKVSGEPVADTPDRPSKLTALQWITDDILARIAAGETTVESTTVYDAGKAAGFKIDNLRAAAKKCDLIGVAARKGAGTVWSLGEGSVNSVVSCELWLTGWLLSNTEPWVRASDAYTAGLAAGYGRDAIKSASLAPQIRKRGLSIHTEWSVDESATADRVSS